jgi:hypothetical protein
MAQDVAQFCRGAELREKIVEIVGRCVLMFALAFP